MHLADCFIELFAYIRLLTGSPEMSGAEYDAVRTDVTAIIKRLDDKVDRLDVSDELFDDARFAVFAWADEAVLCSGWTGVRDWLRHPLQREYYGTANGGEEFFERLEKLLSGQGGPVDSSIFADFGKEGDPEAEGVALQNGASEVLEVFALCLSLGFTGKYFSESDGPRLQTLRRNCIARIPGRAAESGEPAFPQSYGTGRPASRKCCYGRVFDPIAMIFFILPLLVIGGMYLAYRGLLENSLKLWLG
ncbi:DotU family type IV/VI secretion system protein [Maridesulfovibrio sp. FT414]|uniref:DotU family type IV/VI secretion system protein n=1 Tax=Maridesulfovibrio sp. FT414 TaxID=2979469 RepID=UPI003D806FFE